MQNETLEKLSYVFMKLAKFFVKLAIFFVVIYFIGIRLFDFGYELFYESAMSSDNGKEIVFEIKDSDTVDEIAENLKNAGLIENPFIFKFRAKIYKTNFTPNIYNLKTSMTIKNMLDIFDDPSSDDIVIREASADIYQLSPEDNEESIDTLQDESE